MSFYRSILAAVAAVAIATPVFADDTTANAAGNAQPQQNTTVAQADNTATQATTGDQAGTTATDTKININKATAKDLSKVKGLSMSKAKQIVAYRTKHGDFKSVDDLSNVKGFKKIKPDTLKQIQDQLTAE